MKLKPVLWISAFLAGVAIAWLGASGGVVTAIFLGAFLAMIITYYRCAWRQGHSGIVPLPFKKGPFGSDGLQLKLNDLESSIVLSSLLLIAGMVVGLFVAAA